jgi:hypothetical protein
MSLDPITALIDLGKSVIDRKWPDANKRAEEMAKLAEIQARGDSEELAAHVQLLVGQIEINKVEAASDRLFVAGWRPFVGWVGGASLAYSAIIEPFMRFFASTTFGYSGAFPVIDTTLTMQVLVGILGLGAMRSWDKKNT